jgi:hypothetical protein
MSISLTLRRVALFFALLASDVAELSAADTATHSQLDQDARMVLQKSDEVRFPARGFEVSVAVQTSEAGQVRENHQYKVLSKGNENSIVFVTAPAEERGQMILMRSRELWLFLPSVSQPVRISLGQRLTGQVANGDIARANFSGDYSPQLVGVEKSENRTYYILELTAVDRSMTYQRVRYWVTQGSYWPYKAEFYSLSRRLLKTCQYTRYKELAGRMRPTHLIMTDASNENEITTMDYSKMNFRDLPDKIFSKDYLKKLE